MEITCPLNLAGTWHGILQASGVAKPHRLMLEVAEDLRGGSMHLTRPNPDPEKHRQEYSFEVDVRVAGDFLGLLAIDDVGLGVNAMILKCSARRDRLSGQIIFNNVATKLVDVRPVEFQREPWNDTDAQRWLLGV
jgi:hypothetical protein